VELKLKNKRLKSLKTIFLNLIIASKIGKALEVAIIFIKTAKIRVNALKRRVYDASYNNNNNDNIIDVIRIKVKTTI
jgi:hypothetical protein